MSAEQLRAWAPVALGLLLLAYVVVRNRRPRRLRVNRLWIVPAVVTLGAAVGVIRGRPPIGYDGIDVALCVGGVALGALAGWWRGRFTHIALDLANGTVTAQTSPVGMLFLVVLLVVRRALQHEAETGAVPLPFNPAALIEPLLYLVVATVVVRRLEMWLRAKRLLQAEAATPDRSPG